MSVLTRCSGASECSGRPCTRWFSIVPFYAWSGPEYVSMSEGIASLALYSKSWTIPFTQHHLLHSSPYTARVATSTATSCESIAPSLRHNWPTWYINYTPSSPRSMTTTPANHSFHMAHPPPHTYIAIPPPPLPEFYQQAKAPSAKPSISHGVKAEFSPALDDVDEK